MSPLDFLAGLISGSVITILFGVVLFAIFAARHAGTPHNLDLIIGLLRDLRDVGTGILHALQILAGTRPATPPKKPAEPRKESPRPA